MSILSQYNIYKSDGTLLCTVSEDTFDSTSSSITLIGKGITDYGETQNTNFIKMLDNFASIYEPIKPLRGQIWFKKETDETGEEKETFELLINNSKDQLVPDWTKITIIIVKDSEPVGTTDGNLWYNTATKILSIYDEATHNWMPAGIEDYLHVKTIHDERITLPGSPVTVYNFPSGLILRNLVSNLEMETDKQGKGVVNQINYSIMAKEVYDDTEGAGSLPPRACVFDGTIVVQTIKNLDGTYSVNLIGGPIKNTLARSNDCDFDIELIQSGTALSFNLNGIPRDNTWISWLVNLKVTAI